MWQPASAHSGEISVPAPTATAKPGRCSPPTERTTEFASTIAPAPMRTGGPADSITVPWSI